MPIIDLLPNKTLLKRLGSFSIIGIINTALHLTSVMTLVEYLEVNSVAANCLAFVLANSFSFYANSQWNYRTPMAVSRYWRFFVISIIGLTITASVTAIAKALGTHYLVGTLAVFVILPVFTFIWHNCWTWGRGLE